MNQNKRMNDERNHIHFKLIFIGLYYYLSIKTISIMNGFYKRELKLANATSTQACKEATWMCLLQLLHLTLIMNCCVTWMNMNWEACWRRITACYHDSLAKMKLGVYISMEFTVYTFIRRIYARDSLSSN